MLKILHLFTITISLLTASGVLIHDSRIDKASSTIRTQTVKRTVKVTTGDLDLSVDPHTHPEKGAHSLKGFTYKNPIAPPRNQKVKKYLQQNIEPRGRHAFDNHYLPLVG